jgi:sulfur carrier protein
MEIKLNGKQENIKDNINVADLLKQKGIQNVEMVTVQLNGAFVNKEDLSNKTITENDEIDFLYFMGGGSKSTIRQKRCYHQ